MTFAGLKRITCLLVAIAMLFGCAPSQDGESSLVQGTGELTFEPSSSEFFLQPESPPVSESIAPPSSAASSVPSSAFSASSSDTASSASFSSQTSSALPSSIMSASSIVSTSPESSSMQIPSSVSSSQESSGKNEEPSDSSATPENEMRGVWLSYLDLGSMLTGKTEQQFRNNVAAAFEKMVQLGMNTVFAQVRPFGDALYPSEYFPASYLFSGIEGRVGEVPFDALEIMVEEAHAAGLAIEAWVNPYRIRAAGTLGKKPLSDDNPANIFLNAGSDAVVEYENGLFYNPGSAEARALILAGIEEIVENYDVDGIHFDDYFYPAGAAASFDRTTYQDSGSSLSLADWRREQVNILVREVYDAVGSDLLFGISPAGNNSNNWSMLYCDVETWVSEPGYIDYICPQVYFGFQNSTCPYRETVELFNDMITVSSVKLYVGLAAYKIGDAQYGSEWTSSYDMMQRQVEFARTQSEYGGFALYRYDFTISSAVGMKKEMRNLQAILD